MFSENSLMLALNEDRVTRNKKDIRKLQDSNTRNIEEYSSWFPRYKRMLHQEAWLRQECYLQGYRIGLLLHL